MRLTFIGACHEVTGSCHVLEACGKKILVDYGLRQGREAYERKPLPFPVSEIDYVLVTHAHIDHTGMLPALAKEGFTGAIYATRATCDLCDIMLKDSAHIQEADAEWKNRKSKRSGKEAVEPLYTMDDALEILTHFVPCDYLREIELCENIRIRFTDVGHLLGSASIEVWMTEEGMERKVVFSGDLGNYNQPLIKDMQYTKGADYVLIESTYGTRVHTRFENAEEKLISVLQSTFEKGGNLVIPCFAVGRTQELLYMFRKIKAENLVPDYPDFKVYVDSPLAVESTNVFRENMYECFDEEAMALIRAGINPLTFDGLKLSVSTADSISINETPGSKVILSASGMCDAGRIRHHLKHNLWRPESTILFSGYQAEGSTGRVIIDGVKDIKLFGEDIHVNARIEQMEGISGHADKNGLLNWLSAFEDKPVQVFCVHGAEDTIDTFAKTITESTGLHAVAPYSGWSVNLLTAEITEVAPEPVKKESQAKRLVSQIYQALVAAGQRLMTVIKKNQGGTNRDLKAFTEEIEELCNKYDR